MDCSLPGISIHGDSPGRNTGVGCYVFLQGIFPILVSHIAGRFSTVWASRVALSNMVWSIYLVFKFQFLGFSVIILFTYVCFVFKLGYKLFEERGHVKYSFLLLSI